MRTDAVEILDNVDAAFVSLDQDLRFSYLNAAAEELLGIERRQAGGRAASDVLPGFCTGEAKETCRRALEQRERARFEAYDTRLDRWYEVLVRPSPEGGIWAWFIDITGRKRDEAERNRLQSEFERQHQFLQTIIDHAPAGIAVVRAPDFVFELINPAYAAFAPEKPMIGRTVREVWPEFAEMILPPLRHVAETGERYYGEDVLTPIQRTPGGPLDEGYFTFSYVRLGDATGAARILVFVVETTQHVHARQKIEKLASQAEAILASMTEGLLIADRAGNVLSMNPAALRMYGLARPEDAVQHISNFTEFEMRYPDGRSVPPEERPLMRLLRGEPVSNFEVEMHPRGREPWIASYSGTTVRDSSGQPALAVLTVRDTTQARQLERERYRAQKVESLSVLAGGVAHTFNNLLTGIIGNVSMALDMAPAQEQPARLLQAALASADAAANLARQLLAYSGRSRFVLGPVDLSELARETSTLIQNSLAKNVKIHILAPEPGPLIEADAGQIQQLVTNLVMNAVEAIGPGYGDVIVATGERDLSAAYLRRLSPGGAVNPGRYAYLKVQDSGAGMDSETLAKVFDPFFTTKATGRGLGLAAVLGITRAHQGAIGIESTPGRGTIVKVFLPLREQ
jgi:PAS domain S-box-containing protein